MLVSIASGVLSALSSIIVTCTYDGISTLKLQDAPSWYMKSEDGDKLYSYAYIEEGKSGIDRAKREAVSKMASQIDSLVAQAIKQNFQNAKTPSDKEFLSRVSKDKELPNFVTQNTAIEKLEQRDARSEGLFSSARAAQIFVKASLSKKTLLEYERQRLENIRLGLMKHRASEAEIEMESSEGQR